MKYSTNSFVVPTLLALCLMGKTALATEQSCKDLINTRLSNGQITVASYVAAGPASKDPMAALTGASMATVELPAHCLVQGRIGSRTGAEGKSYAINFEVRLPDAWQQRLLFQGGGAMDGFLANALGRIPVTNATAKPALARGYAVVSMDGGHQGLDAAFARDQQARVDFAYAAIGKVWNEAKGITREYYRQPASYTYFMGCSNGGREAMIAAQRYPTEFDGIVAGNPGFRLSCAAVSQAWDSQVLMRIAPKDSQGRKVLAKAFSPAALQLVAKRITDSCDALDGLKDGLINNFQACKFNPKVLQCRPGEKGDCLRAEQVEALNKLFDGPRNSAGKALYSTWPFDTGIAADGWRAWKMGFSNDAAKPDALNAVLGADSLKNYFMTPPNSSFDALAFDFDHDMDSVAQTGALNDAVSTYMTTFKARGGKMLIYQGVSDPVFSASDISRWYEQLQQDTDAGDAAQTRQWARLFMVAGMTHCGDGPALNEFDPLAAIEDWVEQKRAPDSMPATGRNFPGKTQPLCPYPQYAKYLGGNVENVRSYNCTAAK